jgi:hypothetical protein
MDNACKNSREQCYDRSNQGWMMATTIYVIL